LTVDSNTTGTLSLGTGNNAKTIAIGTGTAGNAINIGTDNTTKDTINIGSALDDVAITGDQWSITNAGVLTVASCTGCGGSSGFVYYAKNADQSVNNSTTLTDETALQVTLGASEEWNILWHLMVTNSNDAGGDWKSAVKGAASTACTAVLSGTEPAGAAFPQATTTDCDNAPTAMANGTIAADVNVPFEVLMTANVTAPAGGATMIAQWAQNTQDVSNLTIKAGSFVQAFQVTGADLAEVYSSAEPIDRGYVVSIDPTLTSGVKKSEQAYDRNVLGVVSTRPGLLIGDNKEGFPVMVALAGRVPVKVTSENGLIRAGDLLTASSTPGVAMRATKAGQIIGQAITSWSGEGIGEVLAFVKASYGHGAKLSDIFPGLSQEETGRSVLTQFIYQKEQLTTSVDLSEIVTDRVAAGLEVVAPRVLADEIVARNAIFSGEVVASRLRADQIVGLDVMLASISAESSISGVSTSLAGFAHIFEIANDVVSFIKQILFRAPVEFAAEVVFRDRVTFDSDTAGIAVIPKSTTSVDVVFEKPYETPPIVTISLVLKEATDSAFLTEAGKAAVAAVTEKGFTIVLNEPVPRDLEYNWVAIAIADAKRTVGKTLEEGGTTLLPTPSATVTPTATPVPTPTPEASPSATLTPTPTPLTSTVTILSNELGFVRVRDGPSIDASEIGQIPSGETVPYDDVQYGWYHVTHEEKTGWISGTFVEDSKEL